MGPTGAALSISPLRLEIGRDATGATVYVTNGSEREVAIQSRVFAWAQKDGEDVYAPSGDVTIAPSIAIIPPGQTQIVRLLRRGAASPGEKRYRFAVDQLPDPTLLRAGQAEARIRFTLPLFLDRDSSPPAKLAWRLGDDRLELANLGGATARIVDLKVEGADHRPVEIGRNVLRYVQGQSTIAWPLAGGCSLGAIRVTALIDDQTVYAEPAKLCG